MPLFRGRWSRGPVGCDPAGCAGSQGAGRTHLQPSRPAAITATHGERQSSRTPARLDQAGEVECAPAVAMRTVGVQLVPAVAQSGHGSQVDHDARVRRLEAQPVSPARLGPKRLHTHGPRTRSIADGPIIPPLGSSRSAAEGFLDAGWKPSLRIAGAPGHRLDRPGGQHARHAGALAHVGAIAPGLASCTSTPSTISSNGARWKTA